MSALTANRNTRRMGDEVLPARVNKPVADNVHIYQGAIVVQSGQYVQPATAAPGLVALGIAIDEIDNTVVGHTAGGLTCTVREGVFKFENSSSSDLIAASNEGSDCYLVDDHTVALTDGGNGARSRAGKIVQVDTDGVWVLLGAFQKDEPVRTMSFPLDLASIAAGQVIGAITMPFGGKVKSAYVVTNKPATTSAKAATLQPRITPSGGSAAATTGGAIAMTSANQTPQGNVTAGTAITAANSFKAGDQIDVQASSVTAFVEGSATLVLVFGP